MAPESVLPPEVVWWVQEFVIESPVELLLVVPAWSLVLVPEPASALASLLVLGPVLA